MGIHYFMLWKSHELSHSRSPYFSLMSRDEEDIGHDCSQTPDSSLQKPENNVVYPRAPVNESAWKTARGKLEEIKIKQEDWTRVPAHNCGDSGDKGFVLCHHCVSGVKCNRAFADGA